MWPPAPRQGKEEAIEPAQAPAQPAYPTGEEIRTSLPVRDPLITKEQCQGFVNEWAGLIREAGGAPDRPTFTAVRIVRRGAWADAVEWLMTISEVPVEDDVLTKTREWAEKALERFDASAYSAEEGAAEATSPRATVRNVTPEPLWGEGYDGFGYG